MLYSSKKKKLKLIDGTYNMWRKRNPAAVSELNALQLNRQRRIFEKCLKDDGIDKVLHELNQEEDVRVNQKGNVYVNQEGNVEGIPLTFKSVCRNVL